MPRGPSPVASAPTPPPRSRAPRSHEAAEALSDAPPPPSLSSPRLTYPTLPFLFLKLRGGEKNVPPSAPPRPLPDSPSPPHRPPLALPPPPLPLPFPLPLPVTSPLSHCRPPPSSPPAPSLLLRLPFPLPLSAITSPVRLPLPPSQKLPRSALLTVCFASKASPGRHSPEQLTNGCLLNIASFQMGGGRSPT